MSKVFSTFVAAAALLSMTAAASAQQNNTKVGMLTCKASASLGLIIGSHQGLACKFEPNNGRSAELYSGYINRLGVDIGFTAGGVMAWAVIAHSAGVPAGALAGKYIGASGDIALGFGVGGNALVGGSGRSFALQPLSVEGEVGVNLALGVAGLTLASGR